MIIKSEWYVKDPKKLPYTGKYPRAGAAIDVAVCRHASKVTRTNKGQIWAEMKNKGYRLIQVTEYEHQYT